jgi:hypothetical protein
MGDCTLVDPITGARTQLKKERKDAVPTVSPQRTGWKGACALTSVPTQPTELKLLEPARVPLRFLKAVIGSQKAKIQTSDTCIITSGNHIKSNLHASASGSDHSHSGAS